MFRSGGWWAELVGPAAPPAPIEGAQPNATSPRVTRDRAVDALACLVAAVFAALFLTSSLSSVVPPLPREQILVDVVCGALACLSLWWRRRWPLRVALLCVLLGAFSASATAPGLFALFSLAIHRPARPALLVASVMIPSALLFAVYSPTTDPVSVLVVVTPLALAATAWGMYVRARRQLLMSLRERALRAEADQRLHEDRTRMAERTRIAREMHDVLAHRISLMALHAGGLEVRPDLPSAQVLETAQLLRSTARQALEELRSVIGVLREDPGQEPGPLAPQPTLSDIRSLVEETRRAGAKIDLEMRVQRADLVPDAMGRDAYRIVQEALTNIGKHATGTATRVRVTGAPEDGLQVSVRNRQPIRAPSGPALPGSGAGLLGLQERVALTGGILVHGPDGSGDFVVEAELKRVKVKVLLVDDDALVRAGLRMILSSADDLEVVAETDDGIRAVAAVREHRPDVVLMDIRMKEMDGITATAALRRLDPAPQVIVLTTYEADHEVMSALRAGASGFLVKDTPPGEIINAVRLVACGDAIISPSVTRTLLSHFSDLEASERRDSAARRIATLTDREREVATSIGAGASNAEVATSLFMSEATVKAHVSRIFTKLDVTSRVQIAIVVHDAGQS